VAGIGGRLKKNQISCLELFRRYGPTLFCLYLCCSRQINIEKIGVNRFHKTGAVYSTAVCTAQPMPSPLPATVFLTEALFDFIIIEGVFGGLMML
jgi:hypothetical protein